MNYEKKSSLSNYQITFLILFSLVVVFSLTAIFQPFSDEKLTSTEAILIENNISSSNGKDAFGDIILHYCSLVTRIGDSKEHIEFRYYSKDIFEAEGVCNTLVHGGIYKITHFEHPENNFYIATDIFSVD